MTIASIPLNGLRQVDPRELAPCSFFCIVEGARQAKQMHMKVAGQGSICLSGELAWTIAHPGDSGILIPFDELEVDVGLGEIENPDYEQRGTLLVTRDDCLATVKHVMNRGVAYVSLQTGKLQNEAPYHAAMFDHWRLMYRRNGEPLPLISSPHWVI